MNGPEKWAEILPCGRATEHSPVAFGLCPRNEIEVVVRIELQNS